MHGQLYPLPPRILRPCDQDSGHDQLSSDGVGSHRGMRSNLLTGADLLRSAGLLWFLAREERRHHRLLPRSHLTGPGFRHGMWHRYRPPDPRVGLFTHREGAVYAFRALWERTRDKRGLHDRLAHHRLRPLLFLL